MGQRLMGKIFQDVLIFVAAALVLALAGAQPASAAIPALRSSDPSIKAIYERTVRPANGCFERVRAFDPLLRGEVSIHIRVASSGAVETATIERSLGDAELNKCLVDLIKAVPFATVRPGEMFTTSFTYAFRGDPSLDPIRTRPKLPSDIEAEDLEEFQSL